MLRISDAEGSLQVKKLKSLFGQLDRWVGDVDAVDIGSCVGVATEYVSVPTSDVEYFLTPETIELVQATRKLHALVPLTQAVVGGEELRAAKRRVDPCGCNRVRLPAVAGRIAIGGGAPCRQNTRVRTPFTGWRYGCSVGNGSRAGSNHSDR